MIRALALAALASGLVETSTIAQPLPERESYAVSRAVKVGCLPNVFGQLEFVERNASELKAAGLVLPQTVPTYLEGYAKPPFQIMELPNDGDPVWVVANDPGLTCMVFKNGASQKDRDYVVNALMSLDWKKVSEGTGVQNGIQKKSLRLDGGPGGSYIIFMMSSPEASTKLPIEAQLTQVTLQRIVP